MNEGKEIPVQPPVQEKELDMSEIISIATEKKIVLEIPAADTETTITDQEKFANDFDKTILEEEEANQTVNDTVEDAAQNALFDNEQLAPAIIETVDILQQQLLPTAFEKTLDESDRVAMKYMIRQFKAGALDKNPNAEGMRIIEIMEDYQNYLDKLPFTKEEKKSILIPLKQVLKSVNIQTTPEKALMYSVFMLMLPRAIPLAKNQFFRDKKEETK